MLDRAALSRHYDLVKKDPLKREAFLTELRERELYTPDVELNFPIKPPSTEQGRIYLREVETFAPRTFKQIRYTPAVIKDKMKAEQWLQSYYRLYPPFSKKFALLIDRIRQEDLNDREKGIWPRKHLIYIEDSEAVPYLAAALESNDFMKMRIYMDGKSGTPKKVLNLIPSEYGMKAKEAIHTRKETFVVMTSSLGHKANGEPLKSTDVMENIFTFRDTESGFYSTTPKQMKTFNPHVAKIFNSRGEGGGFPDNTEGQVCRFLIIDSNNTEGLDVFDIGHFWILQPPREYNKLLQIIGRVTRSCGNRGLAKKKNLKKGVNPTSYDKDAWTVNVHLMASAIKVQGIPDTAPLYIHELATDMDKLLNLNLAEEMENMVEKYAIDAELYKRLEGNSGESVVDQTRSVKSIFYTHAIMKAKLEAIETMIPRSIT